MGAPRMQQQEQQRAGVWVLYYTHRVPRSLCVGWGWDVYIVCLVLSVWAGDGSVCCHCRSCSALAGRRGRASFYRNGVVGVQTNPQHTSVSMDNPTTARARTRRPAISSWSWRCSETCRHVPCMHERVVTNEWPVSKSTIGAQPRLTDWLFAESTNRRFHTCLHTRTHLHTYTPTAPKTHKQQNKADYQPDTHTYTHLHTRPPKKTHKNNRMRRTISLTTRTGAPRRSHPPPPPPRRRACWGQGKGWGRRRTERRRVIGMRPWSGRASCARRWGRRRRRRASLCVARWVGAGGRRQGVALLSFVP